MCVRCLVVLACSYLSRYGAHIIKHELFKWLGRLLAPVTALAKKGGLTIAEMLVRGWMRGACTGTHVCYTYVCACSEGGGLMG